jgi:hypothetical protein
MSLRFVPHHNGYPFMPLGILNSVFVQGLGESLACSQGIEPALYRIKHLLQASDNLSPVLGQIFPLDRNGSVHFFYFVSDALGRVESLIEISLLIELALK